MKQMRTIGKLGMVSGVGLAILMGLPAVAQPPASQPAGAPGQPGAQPPAGAPAGAPEVEKASTGTAEKRPEKKAPIVSKAWISKIEPEPPSYVKTVDKFGLKNMDWLELGLEHRTRFEYRDDDYRRPQFGRDEPFHMRSRGYVGVKKIIDPLRFGFEFNDGRLFNSKYPDTTQDVDENDIMQLFSELYFKDALGKDQPFRFQFGRMAFDYVDRKLVSRSRWRNTTTSFDGFRLQLGQPKSDWQFDTFMVEPVERRLRQPDRTDEEQWFYGMVGYWRKWAQYITLEPYYFILDADRKLRTANDREIHTMGLHGYGPIGKTGFDYDFDTAFQFGEDGARDQRAFAASGEVGYTFQHKWKPRLSIWNVYASGDRDPSDGLNERFDRLYGDGHGFSTSDLFAWQNIISTKLRMEFAPTDKLKADCAYGGYWLASDSDVWPAVAGRRDVAGQSGDFVGQEFEARVRYQLDPRAEIEVGYSHFIPGPYIKNTGPADDSDFFYVSTTLQL